MNIFVEYDITFCSKLLGNAHQLYNDLQRYREHSRLRRGAGDLARLRRTGFGFAAAIITGSATKQECRGVWIISRDASSGGQIKRR